MKQTNQQGFSLAELLIGLAVITRITLGTELNV